MLPCRWSGLLEEISERLRSSKALQQLWQGYKELHQQTSANVSLQEEKAEQLLETPCGEDIADDHVSAWIQRCGVSATWLCSQQPTKGALYISKNQYGYLLHLL